MKTLLVLLICVSPVFADTYLYRIKPGAANAMKILAQDKESKDDRQPYVNTYVLATPDTNYMLLKITPSDGQDPGYDSYVGSTELYQVQKFDEEGFIRPTVDNSKVFPIDKNWKVEVSSK